MIVTIQLPDSASLQRTQEVVKQVAEIARKTPGVAHTVGIAGLSFVLQATSPNFASMFIVLDPFEKRQDPYLPDTAIMARLAEGSGRKKSRTRRSRSMGRRRCRGWAWPADSR